MLGTESSEADEYGPPWDLLPPPGLHPAAVKSWRKRQRAAKAAADRQALAAAGKTKKFALKMHSSHTAGREKPWYCKLCSFYNPVIPQKNSHQSRCARPTHASHR